MKSIKSQTTIFIIVSIVLLVSAGFYASKSIEQKRIEFFESSLIKPEYDKLKNSIAKCSDNSALESLNYIGTRGGYYQKPEEYLDLGFAFIPFYYNDGKILVPEKKEIEKQLCKAYNEEIVNCIKNIEQETFLIDYSWPRALCQINEDSVLFNNYMKIKIEKDENTISIDMKNSPVKYNSLLNKIIELSIFIVDLQKDRNLCITCISNKAGESNLYVNMFNLKNSTNLFVISENATSPEPYYFEFLVKPIENESQEYIAPELPMMPIAG